MIEGIEIAIDREAVTVRGRAPLRAVSSAVVGGGFGAVRSIVNLHVPKNFPCENPEGELTAFVRRRELPRPCVGLMTSAWTEKAELAVEAADAITALALVTVGLGNPVRAGRSPVAAWRASTINTIIILDAAPEPAALVNLVMTATEVKALTLAEAGIRSPEGSFASGTSTDAVVVAATDRGRRCRFGGPASEMGWLVARAVRSALEAGIRRWVEEQA
ncbi:MAG: adenosylcobinamide amidohydrolase [Candidatus Rokubacteria bacterium]|nr:adenosylcobinamide amidohydrolase [Candidatus Rokubacteria bacterium]